MRRTPPVSWTIPVLETERLCLRAHTFADFDAYCALWADPSVVRYLCCHPNSPGKHGNGYATEAVQAVLHWGRDRFTADEVCLIDPENAASLRVAEKSGFRHSHAALYRGRPIEIKSNLLRARA